MSKSLNTKELVLNLTSSVEKKASTKIGLLILSGFLAGAYISMASHLSIVASTGWEVAGVPVFYGLKKIIFGAVFSVGLMLVVIGGSQLFTSNCLIPLAVYEKKVTLPQMLNNWVVVWFSNLLGALFLVLLLVVVSGLYHGEVGYTAMKIAESKAGITGIQMFVRGIMANWLVCLAVLMATASEEVSGKVWAIFFPVMAFVASSFEHSIANMYFLPAGLITKIFHPDGDHFALLTLGNTLKSLGIVTLGNIVGGSFFVGTLYYWMVKNK
ncbi:formate/nitrite transporter family protein [Spirochaeta cellobiosiphila]|uniref:formate/nitrite transporter family protein n=1 Tax=Spirochaeta cellobiosiphila TaxID=504483 RepID=UPI00040856E8|nr:formate/nitrite transporter family protein [Spirochaeta cellobiosiphila]